MDFTPQQLVDRMAAILPGFADRWRSADNLFRHDDGTFTLCGVFAECSHFVRKHYQELSSVQRRELAAFLEQCMADPGTELVNAAATCFLENLANESFSQDFKSHLHGHALEFFRQVSAA